MQEHDKAIEAFEKQEEAEQKLSQAPIQEEKKEDPELKKALADGYNPNHPDGLSPREFNLRGPLFEKIADLNKEKKRQAKEIAELKQMIAELGTQMSKSEARVVQREAHELQKQRMEAVELGDTNRFAELDRQYQELQESIRPNTNVPATKLSQDAQNFIERNSDWFNYDTSENAVMYDEAVAFEQRYIARREMEGKPPLSHAVLGKRIEEYIKTKFPHRFENVEASKPPAVEAGGSPVLSKEETSSMDDLSPYQQEVFKRMKSADPSMTPDKYLKILGQRTLIIE